MYQPTTELEAEELQVVTEAALDVELLGLAVQPRAERVVPKVLRVVFAIGAPEAALAVDQYGLALQILPKHADPLAGELWRGADGTAAPMLAPPVLEVLLTRMNARHHRSAPRSRHMYTDSHHLQAFAQPASQPASQHADIGSLPGPSNVFPLD